MATQATSATASLSLAPEQVNGSGTQTVQVQQPQASAGIVGNGQSTIATANNGEESQLSLDDTPPRSRYRLDDDDEGSLAMFLPPGFGNPQDIAAAVKFLTDLDNVMSHEEQIHFFGVQPGKVLTLNRASQVAKSEETETEQPGANGTGNSHQVLDPRASALLYANSAEGRKIKLHSEQERAVAAFVRASLTKAFPNRFSEHEIGQEIEQALKLCRAFTGAELRTAGNFVENACSNVGMYCPDISTADIKLFAASRGYKIEVTEQSAGNGVRRVCTVTGTLSRAELEQLLKAKPDDSKKA